MNNRVRRGCDTQAVVLVLALVVVVSLSAGSLNGSLLATARPSTPPKAPATPAAKVPEYVSTSDNEADTEVEDPTPVTNPFEEYVSVQTPR